MHTHTQPSALGMARDEVCKEEDPNGPPRWQADNVCNRLNKCKSIFKFCPNDDKAPASRHTCPKTARRTHTRELHTHMTAHGHEHTVKDGRYKHKTAYAQDAGIRRYTHTMQARDAKPTRRYTHTVLYPKHPHRPQCPHPLTSALPHVLMLAPHFFFPCTSFDWPLVC